MTAQDQSTGSAQRHGVPRRVAIFAAASLGLHALLLLLFQLAGLRTAAPPPEPVAIQLVELEPAPPPAVEPEPAPEPEPEEPEPEPEPELVPPEPEPEPEPEQAEAPEEPAPEPEAPQEPQQAEAPDEAEEEPSRSAEAEPQDAPGIAIPGLSYDGSRGTALAWFGHAVECVGLEVRYDDYCADVGPIYLAENDVPRLAPEVEGVWREMMANRPQSGGVITSTGECVDPVSGGNLTPGACATDSGPRLRDLMR